VTEGPRSPLDWVLIGLTILVFAVAITGALWSFTHQAG
jgi:flagellar basal body-associated protein FliL